MRSRYFWTIFVATLVACSSSSDRRAERSPALDGADEPPITASIGHRDSRYGVPSFVWINRQGLPVFSNAKDASRIVVRGLAKTFRLSKEALSAVELREIDDKGGPVVARFTQKVAGIAVFRAGMNIAFTKTLEPVAASGFLATTIAGSDKPFLIDESAASRAAQIARKAKNLARPIKVERVWYPESETGNRIALLPAYTAEVWNGESEARLLVIAADDGRVLRDLDLVHQAEFTYRVFADPVTKLPYDGPQGMSLAPHPSGLPDKRAISYVPSELVTIQNFPFSRNEGWLSPGSVQTSGNNVQAYVDANAPDGVGGGTDTFGLTTAASTFGHVYDTAQSPNASAASVQASITHLFYVTNFLHDWFYDAGFDEAGQNPQVLNYNRGGKEDDVLLAEAHDYSGRNNANAAVPPDGSSPRIQMFIFSGASNASLVVTAPAPAAGTRQVGIASGFGDDVFALTADVVLGQDEGGADPNDGCEALVNNVSGKIALVHRGTCSFAQKAQVAQAAGAAGVIIANVATSGDPNFAPFMGGQQPGITIPVLSLNRADGAALEGGGTVTMNRSLGADLDGALDTSIVAHEWGHVLSSRVVGNGTGLQANQARGLGEGWSDFVALMLTSRQDQAPWSGAYGQGAYATSGSGDDVYYGTRRLPYSVDFTKNALTFRHIANGQALPTGVSTSFGEDGSFNSEVHNTGEVWATMLWECYVGLLRSGRHTFAEAQSRMKRYLVLGMKLTPIDPTLLEARDALLASALAADQADFKILWDAFARRGAGAGAVGPGKDSLSNSGVVESFSADNDAELVDVKVDDDIISCDHDGILDEGETGTLSITVRNSGSGPLTETRARVTTTQPGVVLTAADGMKLQALQPFESATLKVQTSLTGSAPASLVPLDIDVTDPSLPAGKTLKTSLPIRFEADEAEAASATDNVDATKTSWKTAGATQGGRWSRVDEGTLRYWSIAYEPTQADHRLLSAPFTIEDTSFSLSFRHRYAFRYSLRRMVAVDGGVVELTVDGGQTWQDVNQFGTIDYDQTLDASRGDNPLKGRRAYGSTSKGYPKEWISSKVDITLPQHPEAVQVRFRAGYGTAFSIGNAEGWDVDDIELSNGITSKPFFAFVPHQDLCDVKGPTVDAGPERRVRSGATVTLTGSGTHPAELPLTFVWKQSSGPAVTIANNGSPKLDFVAPDVTESTPLTFTLRANDGKLLSPAASVIVTVEPESFTFTGGGCLCNATGSSRSSPAAIALAFGALGTALARRRRRR